MRYILLYFGIGFIVTMVLIAGVGGLEKISVYIFGLPYILPTLF